MAGLGDVLRHLVAHTPNLSPENRAEFTDAVNEQFGAPPEPEPTPEELAAQDEKDAEIARLKAELAKKDEPAPQPSPVLEPPPPVVGWSQPGG